jgi:hypothetical protein
VQRRRIVQRTHDGDNGVEELVFYEQPPVGSASGAIVDANSLFPKGWQQPLLSDDPIQLHAATYVASCKKLASEGD